MRLFKYVIGGFIATLAMLCALSATAQITKCKDASGKTVYSDTLCANTASSSVRIHENTVDTPELRAEGYRLSRSDATEALMSAPPVECRFQYHMVGDAKGKVLATNAKRECIENLLGAKQGLPPSKEAYYLWKDHYEQLSRVRQGAVDRDTVDRLTNAIRR